MTELPDRAELDRMRHELSSHLLMIQEQMTPIYDAADGIRADLNARGWSPTAAEQAALTWLCASIQMSFGGSGTQ
ncbi:hypothetical protein [Streptomyces sp. CBMA152]|uniref:hypothetical protein n=1 Tax=Streptomyces sp. CBMA152 TaxID=1896312 RepID=UPI0016604081|nr:hypothetical protein [Streptomyces sp. CBMA152]MBD0743532.1 hypothetical protein [Streptomyces sp. CBMA152]